MLLSGFRGRNLCHCCLFHSEWTAWSSRRFANSSGYSRCTTEDAARTHTTRCGSSSIFNPLKTQRNRMGDTSGASNSAVSEHKTQFAPQQWHLQTCQQRMHTIRIQNQIRSNKWSDFASSLVCLSLSLCWLTVTFDCSLYAQVVYNVHAYRTLKAVMTC